MFDLVMAHKLDAVSTELTKMMLREKEVANLLMKVADTMGAMNDRIIKLESEVRRINKRIGALESKHAQY